MSPHSIYCLAHSRGGMDRIIHELQHAKFFSTEIGALLFERNQDNDRREYHPVPPTGAAGQSAGPISSGLAWVAGIGRLVVPGVGSYLATGPIIAAMHQARNGTPGVAIARGLIHLGVPAANAAQYEQRIKTDCQILLSVHTTNPNKIVRARAIFMESEAQDICTTTRAPTSRVDPAARQEPWLGRLFGRNVLPSPARDNAGG